jgi:hypothetical protein
MAQKTHERLNFSNKLNYPSNSLKDYYDIIHQLMESFSSIKGIKFSGENAHKELIDYVSKEFFLSEENKLFLQELRNYRNRVSYEGFFVQEDYLKRNEIKIESLIKLLERKIQELINQF